ncbi:MBL fold metallo-hydrolase [Thermodesulfobacteriota bacterium]
MKIKPFPNFDNIIAIAIPFPEFSELITANLYVLGKGPLTLIDTGPKFSGTLDLVRERITSAGYRMEDIERIIITHGHMDHYGLAAGICQAVGHPVECCVHADDKWRVLSENYQEEIWKDMVRFLEKVDLPQDQYKIVQKRFSRIRTFCDALKDVTVLEEGDELVGDNFRLSVIHTPGHTAGSICLYESRQKILFSGDNMIKHITPNPLMEIRRVRLRDPDYQSLKEYLNSLDKLSQFDVRFVFPGHGEYMDDLPGMIKSYIKHHRERMNLVWKALKKKSRPLYHLVDDVFPYVPEGDITLALSEIIVHLEILINEGRAELIDPGPPALYRAL